MGEGKVSFRWVLSHTRRSERRGSVPTNRVGTTDVSRAVEDLSGGNRSRVVVGGGVEVGRQSSCTSQDTSLECNTPRTGGGVLSGGS